MPVKKERIGTILVKAGLLTPTELSEVLAENRAHPDEKLGQTVIRLQLATDTELARALSFQLEIPYIDLDTVVVDPYAIRQIPREIAVQRRLLPVYAERNALIVVMEDPQDFEAIEAARFASGLTIQPHIADADKISSAIEGHYSQQESLEEIMQNVLPVDPVEMVMEQKMSPEKITQLKAQGESPATVKLFNTLILQALSLRASSIYLESKEQETAISNTLDGTLVESMRIPKWTREALASRIKTIAGLDVTQRYERQEGTMIFKMQQRFINLQVVCLPTQHGENILLKFLNTQDTVLSLEDLGFVSDNLEQVRHLLELREGLILACGPIGSGKTTLLYALTREFIQQSLKVVTVESPIEHSLEGAQQVQVNEEAGLSFARAGSSVLRHHPDVLFLGELRDRETATMAIEAAQDTCCILTALRSQNISSALSAIQDFGIDPQLAASSLSGIISLRMVRKLCEQCRETYEPSPELLRKLGESAGETLSFPFLRGQGCQACHYTGYSGQIGVRHVVRMSRGLRNFISHGTPDGKMKESLDSAETKALLKNLLRLAEQGLTTLEELDRVLVLRHVGGTQAETHDVQSRRSVSPEPVPATDAEHTASVTLVTEQVKSLEQIAAPQKSEESGYAFQGKKILLVDDDLDMIQRLKFILKEKRFLVSVANNGEEALAQIHREKPHLIITDVMMPVMNGLELIRSLRKDVTTTFIPVIILSSKNDTADRLKGFAVGTDDYLPKPFSIHELFFRVNAILKRVYR